MSRLMRSPFLLTLRLRSQSFWASWHLRKTEKLMVKELQRTVLLGQLLDSSLLRQKELEQSQVDLQHRLWEMQSSYQYRAAGSPELPTEEWNPLQIGESTQ